ncbi:hypothetical protein PV10_07909 [Exophiala mesophila]|uniref:Amino acid permease/ SLC12A domain-containing protein n=1 Tax=Exophiala mesophila TaxID=212818 RepID=A0A0D1WNM0_EXOME|nr:uncharacterized protein PV10_07909 [Exophiala mesophila]KIV90625.1 hypothetical protein PV10_07909 [Exophiala mesophila]
MDNAQLHSVDSASSPAAPFDHARSQQIDLHDVDSLFSENGDPRRLVTWAPEPPFKLGYVAVMGLIINRMIGTGIFQTPSRVIANTQSTGSTLLLWLAGIVYALSGMHVYIEYGLNVPRKRIEERGNNEFAVPRSGGDLNYFKYTYRKPAHGPDTLPFVASMFSISFIILGNMAGNAVVFAIRIFEASGIENPNNGSIRAVAIFVSLAACFIHGFSRKGGIMLSTLFAMVKLCMMLFIIVTAICYCARAFPDSHGSQTLSENLSPSHVFSGSSSGANGYAQAFLSIIFAFGGFEQPNYVLGEIRNPHRTFPIAMVLALSIVCILYIAVNVSYMAVVPKEMQIHDGIVVESFFDLTYGAISPNADSETGRRVFSTFLAISSLGNIIVMTYTAARVKQEIGKEGLLPWPKFWALDVDFSFGRMLRWARRTPAISRPFAGLLQLRCLAPEHHTEPTPVGAFVLHFLTCTILILATYGATPQHTYLILTGTTAYVLNACFGSLLAVGLLSLRFRKHRDWRRKTPNIKPWLSVCTSVIYLVGNLFPVVTSWVKPDGSSSSRDNPEDMLTPVIDSISLPWFLVPTVGCAVIVLSALWWVGAIFMVRREERRTHTTFSIFRDVRVVEDPRGSDKFVSKREDVLLTWRGREMEDIGVGRPTAIDFRPGHAFPPVPRGVVGEVNDGNFGGASNQFAPINPGLVGVFPGDFRGVNSWQSPGVTSAPNSGLRPGGDAGWLIGGVGVLSQQPSSTIYGRQMGDRGVF